MGLDFTDPADNEAAAAATLVIGDKLVVEGDKGGIWLDVTITRGGDTTGAATVDWATAAGTATTPLPSLNTRPVPRPLDAE